jgi:hypothetical protein
MHLLGVKVKEKGSRRKHHFDNDIAKKKCCSDRNSEEGQVD